MKTPRGRFESLVRYIESHLYSAAANVSLQVKMSFVIRRGVSTLVPPKVDAFLLKVIHDLADIFFTIGCKPIGKRNFPASVLLPENWVWGGTRDRVPPNNDASTIRTMLDG